MKILDLIAQHRLADMDPGQDPRIRAVWQFSGYSAIDQFSGGTRASPSCYGFALIMTDSSIGCCYCERILETPSDWVGQDVRSITATEPEWRIALLDSIRVAGRRPPSRRLQLVGPPAHKSVQRAESVCDLVIELGAAAGVPPSQLRVAMLGVVGRFIAAMRRRNLSVEACDLDPSLIGRDVEDVRIASGLYASEMIGRAHVVVLTGLALLNGTIDGVLANARSSGAKVLIYSQTGHSFSELIDHGASALFSESFPLYTIPGVSEVLVYLQSK